jgi:hypothetical protein
MDGIKDKLAAAHPGWEDRGDRGDRELVELEDGCKSVRSSNELVLGDVARGVSQRVGLAVGVWAEVFIGNGLRNALPSNDETGGHRC